MILGAALLLVGSYASAGRCALESFGYHSDTRNSSGMGFVSTISSSGGWCGAGRRSGTRPSRVSRNTRTPSVQHECRGIRLAFDQTSGQWVGLWGAASATNLLSAGGAPDIEIHTQDAPAFPSAQRRLAAHRAVQDGARCRVEVETADGPWRVTASYEVDPQASIIRRRVSLRWLGAQPVKVTGITLRAPQVGLGGDRRNFHLVPGNFPVEPRLFRDLQPGHRETEEGVWTNTALAVVHSPQQRLSLLAGYELMVDGASVVVEEQDHAVSIAHRFSTLARLAPGDSLDCGCQCLMLAAGSWDDAQRALTRFADSLDNGPPADRPAWLDRGAIYSCYPGGSNDTGFRGGGGFADFEQRLPYLADLGFTALWLNPIHTPPPWVYSISDYRAIAPNLGSADDLGRFVASAHALNMKVLLDLVPHGPNENTPAARDASPEAWTYDGAGNQAHAWGGLAGDYASPAWQAYMSQVAAYWVREFGVDGYRVDCAPGNGPNWKRGDGRRPSASSPLGGLEMLQAVRRAIRPINRSAALFPEAWAPIFFRAGDLVYDYPFYQVMRRLIIYPSTEEWVRDARAWLQMERLTYPRRALRGLVRFTENHDTVRADECFGVGPSRALTALCIFAQGTPMIYQDQEIGFGESLGRWLNLRQLHAELHSGEADYEAIKCADSGVLAFLRRGETGAAVVAVNFTPRRVEATLTWPRELAARFPYAYRVEGGLVVRGGSKVARSIDRHGDPKGLAARVTIPAYRPVVILLRDAEMPSPQAVAGTVPIECSARSGAWADKRTVPSVAEDTQVLSDGATQRRLRLAPASHWFVNTCEGLLLDRFVDRHTPEPAARFARLWRPLEAGLWDGPGNPAIGVIAADGRALIVSDFRLDSLVSARLEDPSSRGESPEIVVTSRGDERPFVVRQAADGWAAVRQLDSPVGRGRPAPPAHRRRAAGEAILSVDPLRIVLQNPHYRITISRRRGGLVSSMGLRRGAKVLQVPIRGSDLYTDWGIYEAGTRVSADVECTPRLEITRDGDAAEVTVRGVLCTASWNGVQHGFPAQPVTRYRITYRADQPQAAHRPPVLRVTFGLTPESNRPDTKAFFAYVLQFGDVTGWFAETQQGRVSGKPGECAGERAFEAARTPLAAARPEMGINTADARIVIRPLQSDGLPQNVFLLDQGGDRLALFVAMLNGDAVALPAGVERAASFDIAFGE